MKRLHVENTHEIPFLKVCLKDYFCPQDYATHFSMAFSQDVHITRTHFVQTSLTTILSEVSAISIHINYHQNQNDMIVIFPKVGGSLGLWLGVGALQASELLVQYLLLIFNSILTRIQD